MQAYIIISFQKEFLKLSQAFIFNVFIIQHFLLIKSIDYLPINHLIKHIKRIIYIFLEMVTVQTQYRED